MDPTGTQGVSLEGGMNGAGAYSGVVPSSAVEVSTRVMLGDSTACEKCDI